jgi:ADP-ribose pyrophosphatase YjhB (NUDIX family)
VAAVRLPREEFARVVRLTPLVSIDLVVRNAASETLVGWRRNRPARDSWFVPGGRIGKDERIAVAFARLAREELDADLRFEQARFLGVFEHLYDDNFAGEPAPNVLRRPASDAAFADTVSASNATTAADSKRMNFITTIPANVCLMSG